MENKLLTTTLVAGMLSGAAGLLTFLIIHHIWIRPIWFVLPPGLVIAALGGLAVGWSYAEIRAGLPGEPWTALALCLVIAITLAPSILIGQLRKPLMDMATFTIPPGQGWNVARHFILELLLTATLFGGMLGWLLGHSWRAVAATALAGLVFALGPGHNIPLLGNTPAAFKGVLLLVGIVLVSAIVLVKTQAWLARGM